MQAVQPQVAGGGANGAPPTALNICRCGVTTPRKECYFCARTREMRRYGHVNRRLTPQQEDAIRASSTKPAQLAGQYGVTVRTIYRILARPAEPYGRVEVGGYHAEFELTDDGPRQRTGWRAA